jgi:hypothetical protein
MSIIGGGDVNRLDGGAQCTVGSILRRRCNRMHIRSLFALSFVWGCMADLQTPPKPGPFVTAVFDPAASPAPLIPLPNDLAKTGGDGTHLNVPDLPSDSPAAKDFNHYLNTLDGFPSSTPGSFAFSAPVDPATITAGSPTVPGSVLIFDGTAMLPLGPSDYTLTPSADGTSVSIVPTRRWTSGSTFVVVVFGGSDAAGVKGATGEKVLASPAMFFLRSPLPLVGKCGDGTSADCACDDPFAKACHSLITGLADAQARQLEPLRRPLSAALDMILPVAGTDNGQARSRANVVLMWAFTVTSYPMAVFDPVRGEVPFPNDVLIDQTTGLVNVPFAPSDPQAAIKAGLNTLDGFSTTAQETLPIDAAADLDPATVVAGKSAILLGVDANSQPEYTAGPLLVNMGMSQAGQLAITPTSALESDQIRYAVIVSNAVKDKRGNALVAPPTIALTRGLNPLVDQNGHTLVPAALSDGDAQQLEVLRKALQPLYMVAENITMQPRENLAALWTFTTQSIARPLLALDELPSRTSLSTAVTITHIANQGELTGKTLAFPKSHLGGIVLGTFTTTRAADPATGLMAFDRNAPDSTARFSVKLPANAVSEPVRFAMSFPATPSPVPVAIVQHGLNGWRGSMMPIADSFAAAGWATIMIDLPFHGARAACTDDAQCVGGAAGSCNKMTGQCAGGFIYAAPASDDPEACALQPLSLDSTDCRPLASGAAFVNPANLFASRDNLRQYVVDAEQLIRVLADAGGGGLRAQLGPSALDYDPAQIAYLGQSLGGIEGAIFLSVAPRPTVGVLNVAGGHLIDIISTGSLQSILLPLLTSLNVQPDTVEFIQLANTARWILDPGDPFAVGQHIRRAPLTNYVTNVSNPAKAVIVQEAGMDTVIPPQFEAALSQEILGPAGVDAMFHAQGRTTGGTIVSTFFATASHGSLLAPIPDASVPAAEQAQAIGFISSSGASLPSP